MSVQLPSAGAPANFGTQSAPLKYVQHTPFLWGRWEPFNKFSVTPTATKSSVFFGFGFCLPSSLVWELSAGDPRDLRAVLSKRCLGAGVKKAITCDTADDHDLCMAYELLRRMKTMTDVARAPAAQHRAHRMQHLDVESAASKATGHAARHLGRRG